MHTFEKHDVASVVCQGKAYFRAADITMILGYKNSAKAIRTHVSGKYIKTLLELSEEASSTIKSECTELEHSAKPIWEVSTVHQRVWSV